jgi:sarcosine oxidase subunit gamma
MILKGSASMLEHQQPLDSPPQAHGSPPAGESGFRVQLAETGLLLLQSASESALQDALTSEIALRLRAPGKTCSSGDYALLWLTPAEWLLECPVKDTDALHSALTRRLARSLAVVADMSDAFACFDLSGARASDVLASGCSLDLRADMFPAGRVARTSLAGVPVIIRKTGEPHGFRCLVDRSFARHIRDWLQMIAR